MTRLISAAVLTAVLAPAVGNVVALAQLAAGCTSRSFTTPSWLVDRFASETSAGVTAVDFHVLNRATNVSVELRCSASSSTAATAWHACSARNQSTTGQPFAASFQADSSTARFLFNETWSCSDATPSKPIKFWAVGNITGTGAGIPLSCTEDQSTSATSCRSTQPLLVKGSLLSPVQITPSYLPGPLGHDTKGCTAQARTPAWEVAATQLNLRKVAGNLQSGNAFVIITNDHIGYTASCGGVLSDVNGPQTLNCQGQTAFRRPDLYQIDTVLGFDPKTFNLTVNQTWFCDDQSAAAPISITASGTVPLPLSCQVFNEETTFCTGGTNDPFAGNITSRALLPPFSLNDPLPTAESPTISSVISPSWWFNNFETNTTRNHSDVVTARFGMELQTGPASTGYMANIVTDGVRYASSSNSSADLPWNKCVIDSVGDAALAPVGCEFRYEMASGFLGVRVNWTVADLDVASPVTFNGEIRTVVPGLTCVTSADDRISCAAPDPAPWRANVTSVTWK